MGFGETMDEAIATAKENYQTRHSGKSFDANHIYDYSQKTEQKTFDDGSVSLPQPVTDDGKLLKAGMLIMTTGEIAEKMGYL